MSKTQSRIDLKSYKPKDADRVFFGGASLAAALSLLLVLMIVAFLLNGSWTTFQQQGLKFVTGSIWDSASETPTFQIFPMLYGSFLISALGLVIAVPVSIATAYFIQFMAKGIFAKVAISIIDLLAALPSILIAMWGLLVLTPVATGWSELLTKHLGFIPIFANDEPNAFRSPFIAGFVVAIMVIPIITSVTREVMSRVDKELIAAAFALGGTSFSSLRRVVIPTARSGILGGILLGLGRALGETIAIYYVLNLLFETNFYSILEPRGGSIASLIISRFGEATPVELRALMAAGVVLFVFTLIVNMLATAIVQRSEKRMAS
ncbi:unannotated protein [freshwater metagenome]|uniref:Unannotated protein n=1 Tax=freshwater metagenome TaxID=449393 RepID=A0A6J7SVJ5_9ZZZZ|nr:phosphate ABC transporter permease subunit PstC [Actinomycetota bacterium]MSW24245.1 phosphate ABC transporter permease subunit PstC [Actinomycetota bacterium]MSX29111.1 phosphate ABC transporter permease subunit PstC [Actinomycetota bacterium]MSX43014.1 phosphate ABC transporter permease subunit PstC [Actinomycetota bacterium]MSX97279.1 phosphate ABC transporter permease subunit PstC [Actinomycetota bacterium]